MGGDGGSIPTRTDLVKMRKKKEDADPHYLAQLRWNYCSMSQEPLIMPVAMDELGNLFSKETVVKFLLKRKEAGEDSHIPGHEHIRGLKDLITLNLTANASMTTAEKKDANTADADKLLARWSCPITNMETNGKNKFVALRGCGCVFADKALRQVPSEVCLRCSKPFVMDDVIVLVGNTEETLENRVRMENRRTKQQLQAAEKKKNTASSASKASAPSTASKALHGPSTSATVTRPAPVLAGAASAAKKPRQ
jgi:hypothetical protein